MNLFLARYFLFAGLLLLGTWAHEELECQELVKASPLEDHTQVKQLILSIVPAILEVT